MSIPKKWIIDTNVVVHWVMAKHVMQSSVKYFNLSEEFLDVYTNRYQHSVSFISKIMEMPRDNHDFVVVELSLNEIFSGVRDEVRSIQLFTKGVPISRWPSRRETQEVKFTEELSRTVYESATFAFDDLFGGDKKIGIIPTTKPSDEETYLDVYSSLVFLHPDLKTQDAILITTGIFEKANYFVSMDTILISLKRELEEKYGMEMIRPQAASNLIS